MFVMEVRFTPPAPLHAFRPPDPERAERIGELWSYPRSRAFAELLIDCEEDRTLRGGRRDAEGGSTPRPAGN